jgi:hypothetical protein
MKITFDFTQLKNAREKVALFADEVAKTETEVVLATECLTVAKRDDGVAKPEEVVKRIEDADRNLKIRQIEANRAAAKLAEAESDFNLLIDGSVEPLITAIEKRRGQETERIGKQLRGILGENACSGTEFDFVINMSDAARGFSECRFEICRTKSEYQSGFACRGKFNDAVLAAEKLFC